ncbi:clotting factor G beta subunit-like [Ixodes scapularis]
MKLNISIFIYATTAAVGTLAVGVITGSAIQEGTNDHTDSQYQCGRRHNVTSISERIINVDEKNENPDLEKRDKSSYEASENQVVCVEIESICIPIQDRCGFFMKDIAVVKLKRSVNFSNNIQPICVPENCADFPATFTAHVAGWGYSYDSSYEYEYEDYNETEEEMCEEEDHEATSENYDDLSSVISEIPEIDKCIIPTFGLPENLREREVDVLNQDQCTNQMNSTVPDHIVCVNGGPCHGDSGGPLMYEENGRWFLAGVVSDGPENCIHPPTPTLFVKHRGGAVVAPTLSTWTNAALASEFELPFSDRTPTEREYVCGGHCHHPTETAQPATSGPHAEGRTRGRCRRESGSDPAVPGSGSSADVLFLSSKNTNSSTHT